MKASDSANSLTHLNDSGCFFCSEGDDPEAGNTLIQSSAILRCGCKFATHMSCWNTYICKEPDGAKMHCPQCKKPIHPWRPTVYADATTPVPKAFPTPLLSCFGLATASLLGLILYFTLH
jgi:hypothetical protein